MVDLHTHILYGIDDGAINPQESLAMCKMAYLDGIRTIVATPHVGKFPNTKDIILDRTRELREKISSNNIGLNLFCGADFEFHPNIFSFIENKSIFTINNSRYLMLDIPYFLLPPNVERHIAHLISLGIIPIIGHPERCLQIQEDLGILYEIIKSGALVQITASSITGKMGSKAKETVSLILKHNLSQIIATDAHSIDKRPPLLSEAVDIASGIIGKDLALAMVTTIPQSIIDDKPVTVPEPKKPK